MKEKIMDYESINVELLLKTVKALAQDAFEEMGRAAAEGNDAKYDREYERWLTYGHVWSMAKDPDVLREYAEVYEVTRE